MQLTPANAAASERRLLGALDFLDAAVARGPFLVGDRFTRADLSAAALLSLLTWPEKHEFRWPAPAEIVEPLAGFREAVAGRPCFAWALGLYRDYR
jgi:glutathione S-transferase